MTEITTTINLFYPLLFLTLIVLFVITGIVLVKSKDNFLFDNIDNRRTGEHIDVTSKFSKAHADVVHVCWDIAHEKEMHAMEQTIKEIDDKVNMLIDRFNSLKK